MSGRKLDWSKTDFYDFDPARVQPSSGRIYLHGERYQGNTVTTKVTKKRKNTPILSKQKRKRYVKTSVSQLQFDNETAHASLRLRNGKKASFSVSREHLRKTACALNWLESGRDFEILPSLGDLTRVKFFAPMADCYFVINVQNLKK